MIKIEDNDLPITVAEKIVNGKKPNNAPEWMLNAVKALTGSNEGADSCDMFSLEEIKEIADYLMVYVNGHQNGD